MNTVEDRIQRAVSPVNDESVSFNVPRTATEALLCARP